MAEQNTPQEQPVQQAPDEFETKFKTRLREQYGIEEDPDSFKTKRETWQKHESEAPQYIATINALIEYVKQKEALSSQTAVPQQGEPAVDEERLRNLARLDPYEVQKRQMADMERRFNERLEESRKVASQASEQAVLHREGLRRAHDTVKENWPEAFDQNSELHKAGKAIFNQEMSPQEQAHPMAFLIATERAAGRLGVAPKGRRGNSSKRAHVDAQNISRSGVRGDDENEDDKPLTPRQKQIAAGLQINEKDYKQSMKTRREQAKLKKEND